MIRLPFPIAEVAREAARKADRDGLRQAREEDVRKNAEANEARVAKTRAAEQYAIQGLAKSNRPLEEQLDISMEPDQLAGPHIPLENMRDASREDIEAWDRNAAQFGGDALGGTGGPENPPAGSITSREELAARREQLKRERAGLATQSLLMSQDGTPDQKAADLALAEKAGVSPLAVEVDRQSYQVGETAKRLNAYETTAPKLRRWMDDPQNLSVSHDDDTLSWWEQGLSGAAKLPQAFAAGIGPGSLEYGAGYYQRAAEVLDEFFRSPMPLAFRGADRSKYTAAELAFIDKEGHLPETPKDPNAVLPRMAADASVVRKFGKELGEQWTPKTSGDIEAGIVSAGKSLGQLAPWLFGAAVMKSPGAAMMGAEVTTSGTAYGQARDDGKGVFDSALYSLVQGKIEKYTEMLPMHAMFGEVDAGGWITRLAKRFGKSIITDIPGEQIATLTQDAHEQAILHPEKTWGEYLTERPSAALQTLVASVVQSAFMSGVSETGAAIGDRMGKQAEIGAAKDRQAFFALMGSKAKDSKLLKRLPQKYRDAVEAMTKDGPVETLSIPADKFVELFQSKEVDPNQIAEAMGVTREQLAEATASGSDITVRTSDYSMVIAGTDNHALLAPHLRFKPTDMTAAEAETEEKQLDALFGETVKRFQDAQDGKAELADKEAQLLSTITEQIKATGTLDPRTGVAPNADVLAAMTVTLARMAPNEEFGFGVDPVEYWKQHGPTIRGNVAGQTVEADGNVLPQERTRTPQQIDDATILEASGKLSDKQFEAWKLATTQGMGNRAIAVAMGGPEAEMTEAAVSQLLHIAGKRGFVVESTATEGAGRARSDATQTLIAMKAEGKSHAEVAAAVYPDREPAKAVNQVRQLAHRFKAEIAAKRGELVLAQTGDKNRGTYSSAPGRRSVIDLFEARDLSTLMHEAAHWYLDTLLQMEQSATPHPLVTEQLDAIYKWHGTNRDTPLFTETGAITPAGIEIQEAFAETFVQYLKTGKAPSAGLRKAFAAFKSWLTRLYEDVKFRLGQTRENLTPEISEVFDRMLASREEIAAAHAELAMDASALADAMGLTPAEKARVGAKLQDAKEQAEADMTADLVSSYFQNQKTWWKDEERKTRDEVVREIDQRPEQRALAILSGKGYMGEIGQDPDQPFGDSGYLLPQAQDLGYTGTDTSEAAEWIEAHDRGLDMSLEARMARAKAMGFTAKLFHETTASSAATIEAFDLTRRRAAMGDHIMPIGVFTKPTAAGIGIGGNGDVQMELRVRLGETRTFEDRAELEAHLSKDPEYARLVARIAERDAAGKAELAVHEAAEGKAATPRERMELATVTNLALRKWEDDINAIGEQARERGTAILRAEGLSSITVNKDVGSFKRAVKTTVVFDPVNIRSVNAAFDPDFVDSPNLLAQRDTVLDFARYFEPDATNDNLEALWWRMAKDGVPPVIRLFKTPDGRVMAFDGATYTHDDARDLLRLGNLKLKHGMFQRGAKLAVTNWYAETGKDESVLAQFATAMSPAAPMDKLAQALEMMAHGRAPEAIWRETGWARTLDGEWVFEIGGEPQWRIEPEQKAQTQFLDELIEWPELFAAVPQLSLVSVTVMIGPQRGYYNHIGVTQRGGAVLPEIMASGSRDTVMETLRHEIQHAIQVAMGMKSTGATIDVDQYRDTDEFKRQVALFERLQKEWAAAGQGGGGGVDANTPMAEIEALIARGLYAYNRGETQARDVERRSRWTPTMRALVMPNSRTVNDGEVKLDRTWATLDTLRANDFIRFDQLPAGVRPAQTGNAGPQAGAGGAQSVAGDPPGTGGGQAASEGGDGVRHLFDVVEGGGGNEARIQQLKAAIGSAPEGFSETTYADQAELAFRLRQRGVSDWQIGQITGLNYSMDGWINPAEVAAEIDHAIEINRMKFPRRFPRSIGRGGLRVVGGNTLGQPVAPFEDAAHLVLKQLGLSDEQAVALVQKAKRGERLTAKETKIKQELFTIDYRANRTQQPATTNWQRAFRDEPLLDQGDSGNTLPQIGAKNWGPVSPPPSIPPMRLDLQAVREAHGEEAVQKLPPAVRQHSAASDSVQSMLNTIRDVKQTLKLKRPKSLTKFLSSRRTIGEGVHKKTWRGIVDTGGELIAAIGSKSEAPGLIHDDGAFQSMTMEQAGMWAYEEGYSAFPMSEDELVEAIRTDLIEPIYRPADQAIVQQIEDAETWANWLDKQGIDINEADPAKLKAAVENFVSSDSADAISPQDAAPKFGYQTGEDLLNALNQAQSRDRQIKAETAKRMAAKFGDPFNDGTIAEKARIHARNEVQARQTEIELDALARAVGLPAAARAARDMARRQLANMTVKQIMGYRVFLTYERRWAKATLEAASSGDMRAAMLNKQRQLVNMKLYVEGAKLAERLEKTRKDLQKYETVEGRRARIAPDYLEQIDGLLDLYELRKTKLAPAERARAKSAAQWVAKMRADGREDEISPEAELLAENADRKAWTALSMDEVDWLNATIRNIAHLGRTKETLLRAKEKRRFGLLISDLAEALGKVENVNPKREQSFSPTIPERAASALRKFHASLTRMEPLFAYLDGKANGPLWNALWRPFAEAADVESRRSWEAGKAFKKLYGIYTGAERSRMFGTRIKTPELKAPGAGLTKMDVITMALNWGNSDNRIALAEGYNWKPEQIEALLNRVMTEKDWQFVEGVWDLIGTFRDDAFSLHEDMTGVRPEAVQAEPFTLANGKVIKGGYYPLKYAGDRPTPKSIGQEKLDATQALEDMGKSFAKPMTRTGHLKARVGSGGKPVQLSIAVLHEHVQNVIHDIAYRRAVVDATRIVENANFQEAFIAAAGIEQMKQLRPWIASIATERHQNPANVLDKVLSRTRKNVTIAWMGYKLGTALQQLVGPIQAIPMIGPHWVALGIAKTLARPTSVYGAYQEVAAKSEFMRDRPMGFDRDVRSVTAAAKQGPGIAGATAAMQRNAFILIGLFDVVVSTSVWVGAYDKAKSGNVEGIEKGEEADAIAYADGVVRRTQQAGRTQDLPEIMRSNEGMKLLTVVYGYFSGLYNQVAYDQVLGNFRRGGAMGKAAFFANMSLLFIIAPMLAEALAGRLAPDDDDDEEWGNEAWLKRQGTTLALGAVAPIPFARDVANNVARPYNDYQLSPVGGAINTMIAAGRQAATGEIDTDFEMKQAVNALGYMFGLPAAQLWTTGDYVWEWLAEGTEDPFGEDPADAAREAILTDRR